MGDRDDSNRPQRPIRFRRHPRSRNPNDLHAQRRNDASAAGLTGADRGEAPPPRQRRRSPAESRPRQPRPRVVTLAGVVLALALIGGVVFAGIHLVRARQSAQSPTAAKPTGLPTHAMTPTATPPPLACDVPASLLKTMPKRFKLAQLLMVGVGDAADARRVVTTDHVGGIFIASWTDLTMLRDGELTAVAHSAGPLGLAVSVDEEGGRVGRLSSLIGPAPSARELAQNETAEQVYELARDHGQKMRSLGITIDFAPVVDVTDAPDDTVIGDRSFSPDPAKVTEYAGAYAKGLRDAGVLPVLKHFPGHGRASGDSHTGGVVDPPLGDLKTLDLVPYRTLVTKPPVGVMIGHMVVPGLTDGGPASLSPAAVKMLRTGTGYDGPRFDGPVFTDDLSTMKAITNIYTVPEAVLKALQAGADTALWVTNTEVPAVLDRLEAALDHHELSMDNVDAAVRRMATVKAMNRCGP
jgi:beta-N-acetylhexosaminidase